jgi:hypothetical protein
MTRRSKKNKKKGKIARKKKIRIRKVSNRRKTVQRTRRDDLKKRESPHPKKIMTSSASFCTFLVISATF